MSDAAEAQRAVPDQSATAEAASEDRRSRWWWVVALLLLLVVFGCLVAQALFPTARSTTGKSAVKGLTPVFSIYGLAQPLGVAAGPDGQVAVADTGAQKVFLYDSQGRLLRRLGSETPSEKVFGVDGIIVNGDLVYVADWIMRRVWIFRTDGTLVDYFPREPTSAEFGENGFSAYDIAFLGTDILTTTADGVYRFDGSTFEFKGRFGIEYPGGHPIRYANGIAAAPDGSAVYVCDVLNRRVIAFDADGDVNWILGKPDAAGQIVSFFGLPRGIAVGARGIVVSDTFHHELYLLGSDGSLFGRYGMRGVVDGQMNFPEGVDFAQDGLLYLADRENDRVQVLRLEEPLEADATLKRKWEESYARAGD